MRDYPERKESLWLITVGPLIWAAHFVLSYATAAVWCAKIAGRDGSLDGARIAIAIYTALALAGIAIPGTIGWRHHRAGGGKVPHDYDTPGDRHRLIGLATLLLSAMSAVGVIYAGLAALFLETCN
ncbi:hypothetical protein [Vulgatibacter sp.]|uniref:hypothetical protein n=1 Tax=Vulgatibacter sp. TaxID=1971226 RepID=UPI003563AC34